MAGLLKYFKRRCDTQKKEKLDTLPDPHGPLSKYIPSSSVGITNIRMHQLQQEREQEASREASSEKRSRGPYILLTSAQKEMASTLNSWSVIAAFITKHARGYKHVPW